MKLFYRYFLILFLVTTVSASVAYACSCIGYDSDEKHIQSTDVIFFGKAIHTIDMSQEKDKPASWAEQSTQFNVIEIWKGKIETQKTIYHSNGNICCICGLVFEPHEYYLVFARINDKGKLSSGSCSGTMAVSLSKYLSLSYEVPAGYLIIFKALSKIPSTKY